MADVFPTALSVAIGILFNFGPAVLVLAVLSCLILGASKAGVVGLGVLSTPLLALVLPASTALAIMLPLMIFLDMVAVVRFRRDVDFGLLRPLLLGAGPGVVLAFLVFIWVDTMILTGLMGAVSIVFGIIGRPGPAQERAKPPHWFAAWLAGAGSGFTSTVANAGTPPVHFFLMLSRLSKMQFIATSVYFFAAVNAVKVPAFAAAGFFDRGTIVLSVMLLPVSVIGWWAGHWLVRHISGEHFALLTRLSLFLVGSVLILRSVT